MSWAGGRQATYLSGVIIFLLVVLGIPAFLYFYNPPSCFDGALNGDELGIDCGGGCDLLCEDQAIDLQVLWSRSFSVTPGVYNAVAYIENQNTGIIARDVPYTFKLFDANNILVYERKGMTTINSFGLIPIFEPSLVTEERVPVRTFFELRGEPVWSKFTETPRIAVDGILLRDEDSFPRVEAQLINSEVRPIENIEIVAVIFDLEGNAIATSRTLVAEIPGRERADIVFTWPEAFQVETSRVDVIPRIVE